MKKFVFLFTLLMLGSVLAIASTEPYICDEVLVLQRDMARVLLLRQ